MEPEEDLRLTEAECKALGIRKLPPDHWIYSEGASTTFSRRTSPRSKPKDSKPVSKVQDGSTTPPKESPQP